jgi:uncharacterized membrane protein
MTVWIVSYTLFVFTDFVDDQNLKDTVGWMLIGATLFNVIVNMIFMFITNYYQLKPKVLLLISKFRSKILKIPDAYDKTINSSSYSINTGGDLS